MRFNLKGPFRDNLHTMMRKVGYHLQNSDGEKSEIAFCRPARGYPRFHIYLKEEGENLEINLHLDQKKPIYKGAPAHSAEYQGKAVEEEAKRIKQMLR